MLLFCCRQCRDIKQSDLTDYEPEGKWARFFQFILLHTYDILHGIYVVKFTSCDRSNGSFDLNWIFWNQLIQVLSQLFMASGVWHCHDTTWNGAQRGRANEADIGFKGDEDNMMFLVIKVLSRYTLTFNVVTRCFMTRCHDVWGGWGGGQASGGN